MAHRASSMTHGLLVHGTRRILPGSAAVFKTDFEAWASATRAAGLRAAFAFPDPAESELMHIVFWAKGDLSAAGPASQAFASSPEHPDTLDVFGTGRVKSMGEELRYNVHESLAGFMRDDHPTGSVGPAMIGFFRRAIKPGSLEDLTSTFQVVCDIWHTKIPGMLAATVCRDPTDERFVQEVRIFTDMESYAAHADKSDQALTEAMSQWFRHYDTAVPFTGALYAEDTSDPSLRTSSIKDKPVKVQFNKFHYGQGGMVGESPMLE